MTLKPLTSAVLMTLLAVSGAKAQMRVDVSKVTCKQYVLYRIIDAKTLSIWLSGHFNEQRNNTIVNVSALKDNHETPLKDCWSHYDAPLMAAVTAALGDKK
jgi:acid stress chaperone HdeB